jgi:hypothetical protein
MNSKSAHTELRAALEMPFSAKHIEWRLGAVNDSKSLGRALPSVATSAIEDRFSEVVGFGGWEAKYRVVEAEVAVHKLVYMFCAISLSIEGGWVTREDCVAITASSESGRERGDPMRAAMADAFKRAAARWGVGRYLYEITPPLVELVDGKRFAAPPSLPANLLPNGESPEECVAAESAPAKTGSAPQSNAQTTAAQELPAALPRRAARTSTPAPAPAAAPASTQPEVAPAATVAEPATSVVPDSSEEAVLAMLEGTALETAKNVLERARNGKAPIALLRNYLKGASAKKLFTENALEGLLRVIDKIEASAQKTATV